MSHLGWRPFKAWGHKGAMEFWAHEDDNYNIKWKINRVYIPASGFCANGLILKVLFDHIKEIIILIRIIMDK